METEKKLLGTAMVTTSIGADGDLIYAYSIEQVNPLLSRTSIQKHLTTAVYDFPKAQCQTDMDSLVDCLHFTICIYDHQVYVSAHARSRDALERLWKHRHSIMTHVQHLEDFRYMKARDKAAKKEEAAKWERLQNGHDYLMGVEPKDLTVEDALEAFGFGKNGLGA